MGSRDFRKREAKKPKKDAKKTTTASIFQPEVQVEIVKKHKSKKEELPEE